MSQLRLINGVTRVTFSNSQASNTSGSSTASGGSPQGCGSGAPTFDLIVFFQPVANAGASGVTSVGAASTTTTTPGGTQ